MGVAAPCCVVGVGDMDGTNGAEASARGGAGVYRAVYELGNEGWMGHVPELPGSWVVSTSLSRTKRRLACVVRDLVGPDVCLDEEIRVDNELQREVDALMSARLEAEEARHRLREKMCEAASLLRERGLSTRDAGAVLGVSQQRVAQLWRDLEP